MIDEDLTPIVDGLIERLRSGQSPNGVWKALARFLRVEMAGFSGADEALAALIADGAGECRKCDVCGDLGTPRRCLDCHASTSLFARRVDCDACEVRR